MITLQRAPAGKPTTYRGHWIVPMSELVERHVGRDARTRQQPRLRYDVLAPTMPLTDDSSALPDAAQLRKTCASLISAKGWIDTFGTGEPMR